MSALRCSRAECERADGCRTQTAFAREKRTPTQNRRVEFSATSISIGQPARSYRRFHSSPPAPAGISSTIERMLSRVADLMAGVIALARLIAAEAAPARRFSLRWIQLNRDPPPGTAQLLGTNTPGGPDIELASGLERSDKPLMFIRNYTFHTLAEALYTMAHALLALALRGPGEGNVGNGECTVWRNRPRYRAR